MFEFLIMTERGHMFGFRTDDHTNIPLSINDEDITVIVRYKKVEEEKDE